MYLKSSEKLSDSLMRLRACVYQRVGNTVKPLNSGHLRVIKILTVIDRSPLLGGNLKKIVPFGT